MEAIKFYKKPRLKNPYFICAWPGMGEVAFKAVSHLINKLGAQEFAEISPERFFYLTGSDIREGVLNLPDFPYSKFYYWKNPAKKNDLVIFLSNAQPDLAHYEEYCKMIFAVIKQFNIKLIVCFAAMPLPIEHDQEPGVWGCATNDKLKQTLVNQNIKIMSEGQISGMNGLFLGMAKKSGLDGFCLLGEIPIYAIQIENPKASLTLIETLGRILDLRVDTKELKEQAEVIDRQINQLIDYLKLGTQQQLPPIGQEEIDRLKKSLGQYTKLPDSTKAKIESLFEQAKKDISKAYELKQELDHWNVYKEYEDRFLDLFKKPKEQGN